MNIRNIIFDFGGVIVTLDQPQAINRFKQLGVQDIEQWMNPYTQQGIFGDLEAGRLSAEDFRMRLSEMAGHELSFDDCCYAWQGYHSDLPKRNLDLLRRLRAEGYRLILLSNTNPFMMEWAESERFDGEGHPLSSYFDSAYKSYEQGLMKPDEMLFRLVLSKEHILPSETLFVDDGPRNCDVASELGIHTLCPVNGEDWTGKLLERLK